MVTEQGIVREVSARASCFMKPSYGSLGPCKQNRFRRTLSTGEHPGADNPDGGDIRESAGTRGIVGRSSSGVSQITFR